MIVRKMEWKWWQEKWVNIENAKSGFLKEVWKCMMMSLCSFEAGDINCDAQLNWKGRKNDVVKVYDRLKQGYWRHKAVNRAQSREKIYKPDDKII